MPPVFLPRLRKGPLSSPGSPCIILRNQAETCATKWRKWPSVSIQFNRSYSKARLSALTIGSAGDLCSLMHSCIYFCWMCQYNCEGTVPVWERNRSPHLSLSSMHCRELPYLNTITLIKYLISKPLKFPWFINIFLLFIRVLNKLFDTLGKEGILVGSKLQSWLPHLLWTHIQILSKLKVTVSPFLPFKMKTFPLEKPWRFSKGKWLGV